MTVSDSEAPERPGDREGAADRRVTIPNALCLFRILAAPVLVVLAASDRRPEVVVLFLAMTASDWIDGKIARLFDQRSKIGPRLDSVADAVMYGALLVAVVLLDGDRLRAEWPWVSLPVVVYLIGGAASLTKFGLWPNHHTRMAKISWGLMLVGAVAFLEEWSIWWLRVALVGATLASLQSLLITRILPGWRADVRSISAARAILRRADAQSPGGSSAVSRSPGPR